MCPMPASIHNGGGCAKLPCDRCIGKQYNVCHVLEHERQKELYHTGIRQRWNKREFLFRADNPVGSVFKVTSGIAVESRSLSDGRRQIISFILPGDVCWFGLRHGSISSLVDAEQYAVLRRRKWPNLLTS